MWSNDSPVAVWIQSDTEPKTKALHICFMEADELKQSVVDLVDNFSL